MQFPDDPTLIARGKYSTLGRERRVQIARAQQTCGTVMTLCHQALKGLQLDQPETVAVEKMQTCLDNIKDAGTRIQSLSEEMGGLKPAAWPE